MNYFLLNSNIFHLLRAEEFKHKYHLSDDCILLCRTMPKGFRSNSITCKEDVTRYSSWGKIFFIPYINSKGRLSVAFNTILYITIFKIIEFRYGKAKRLISCNYGNDAFRYISNSVSRRSEVFFLDEGTSTIKYLADRETGKKYLKQKSFIKTLLFRDRLEHVKGIVNFFTVFNIKGLTKTKIILNENTLLKKKVSGKSLIANEVYFLGSPLVEFGVIEPQYYSYLLKRVFMKLSGNKVVYIPHPRETDKNIEHIRKSLDVEVRRLNLPFELYLIEESELPKKISSFVSTGLINSYFIFGSSLDYVAFKIPTSNLQKKSNDQLIYNFIEMYIDDRAFKVCEI